MDTASKKEKEKSDFFFSSSQVDCLYFYRPASTSFAATKAVASTPATSMVVAMTLKVLASVAMMLMALTIVASTNNARGVHVHRDANGF